MAGNEKDVELRIRARDDSQKTFRQLEKTIKDLIKAQTEQQELANRGEATTKQLAESYDRLNSAGQQLLKLRSLSKQWKDQSAALSEVTGKLEAAKKAQQDYAAGVNLAEATKREVKELERKANAVASLEKAQVNAAARLEKTAASLDQYGISVAKIDTAEAKIVKTVNTINKALEKQDEAIQNSGARAAAYLAQQKAASEAAAASAAELAQQEARAAQEKAQADEKARKSAELSQRWMEEEAQAQNRIIDGLRKQAQAAEQLAAAHAQLASKNIQTANRPMPTNETAAKVQQLADPTTYARQNLTALAAQIDAVGAKIRAMGDDATMAKPFARALEQDQQALLAMARAIDTYKTATANVKAAKSEFDAAEKAVADLAAEMKHATSDTDGLSFKMQQAQQRLASASSTLGSLSTAARNSRRDLAELGIDFEKVGEAEAKVVALTGQIKQHGAAIEQTVKASEQAASVAQKKAAADAAEAQAQAYLNRLTEEEAYAQNRVIDGLRKQADQALATARGMSTLGRVYAQMRFDPNSLSAGLQAIVSPAEAARSTLAGLEGSIASVTRAIEAQGRSITDARGKMQSLQQDAAAAVSMAKTVDAYRQQVAAIRQARNEFKAARADVRYLAGQMRSAQGDTDGLGQRMQQAQQRLAAATNEMNRMRQAAANSRAALSAAGISTSSLGAAEDRLRSAASQATQGINSLSDAMRRNAQASEKAGKSLGMFGESGRTTLSWFQRLKGELLAVATAYVGIYGAINQAGAAIDAYKLKQQALIKAENIVGKDQGAIQAEWQYMIGLADALGVSIETLAPSYTKFAVAAKASGMSLQDTKYIFESILKAGRVYQLSDDDMGGVLKATEQMISKGQVYAEELRSQLAERLPGAVAMFAQQMGVSVAELQKRLQDGVVGADEVINLARGLASATDAQVEAASNSVAAVEARAKNAAYMFHLAMAESGFVEAYVQMLTKLTAYLNSDDGKKSAEKLGHALADVADAIIWCVENAETLKNVLITLASIKALQFLWDFGKGLYKLGLAAVSFYGFIKPVFGILQKWGAAAIASAAGTSILGVSVRLLARSLGYIGAAIIAYDLVKWAYDNSKGVQAALNSLVFTAITVGKEILISFKLIPAAFYDACIAMLSPLDSILGGAVTKVLNKLADLAEKIPGVGSDLAEMYRNAAKDIGNTDRSMVAKTKSVLDEMGQEWATYNKAMAMMYEDTLGGMVKSTDSAATKVASSWAKALVAPILAAQTAAASVQVPMLPTQQPQAPAKESQWSAMPVVQTNTVETKFKFTEDPGTGANAISREVAALTKQFKVLEDQAKKAEKSGKEALMRKNLPGRLKLIDEEFAAPMAKAKAIPGAEGAKLVAQLQAIIDMRKRAEEAEYKASDYEGKANRKAEQEAERRRKAIEALKQKYDELAATVQIKETDQDPTTSVIERQNAAVARLTVTYEALKRKADEIGGAEGNMLRQNLTALEAKNKEYIKQKITLDEIDRLQKRLESAVNIRKSGIDEINAKKQAGVISEDQAVAETNTLYQQTNPQVRKAANDLAEQTQMNTDLLGPEKTAEIMANIAQIKAGLSDLSGTYTKLQSTMVEGLTNGVTNALQSVAESLAGLINGTQTWSDLWTNLGATVSNFFADLLMQMAQAIIKQQILNMMAGWGGGIGNAAQAAGGVVSMHNGGMVGGTGGGVQSRSAGVPQALFANAPRFHTGGFPGLKSDEMPIIAQKGEQILSKNDPNNVLNQAWSKNTSTGGSAGNMRVVLVDDRDQIPQAMNSAAGEAVVVQNIRRNSPTVRAMINKKRRG